MGRYIRIHRINSINDFYYYEAEVPDSPEIEVFYLKIDYAKKNVVFSNTIDFSDKIFCFNFNNDHDLTHLTWLPHTIAARVLYKVKTAIDKNDFSEYISYQS
jgi:hypothetical protein